MPPHEIARARLTRDDGDVKIAEAVGRKIDELAPKRWDRQEMRDPFGGRDPRQGARVVELILRDDANRATARERPEDAGDGAVEREAREEKEAPCGLLVKRVARQGRCEKLAVLDLDAL